MAFEISGYVLEPIRVGQSNSAFTPTPDNLISNQGSFDSAYPASEDNPRNDYLVFVVSEGGTRPGLLESATFGWTKNEVIARFAYDSQGGLFRPLPGAPPTEVGFLAADVNTNRLRVRSPAQAAAVPAAPYRLAVGSSGSGTSFAVTIVANDAGFTSPALGTVQLALDTGNLNWNASDLVTFIGQRVRFQQQQFFDLKETGRLGFAPTLLSDVPLILNPLPGNGQIPLLRFGHGFYLNAVQVANEGSFSVPSIGTVQWALTTGRLNFNPLDASEFASKPVYYDGVLCSNTLQLTPLPLGTVNSPAGLGAIQYTGQDILFTLPNESPYYRFPKFTFVTSFSSGKSGEVQVKTDGSVQFSSSDQSKYSGEQVVAYFGDLLIENGVSIRLLRTPVNLDGALTTVKDVTSIYEVEGAVWADPIIAATQVLLPSAPIEDDSYPLSVKVIQGQGFYTDDDFPDLADNVSGTGTTFIGTTFTDSSATFVVDGVANGSLLVLDTTAAKGTYLVIGVTATQLTTATSTPVAIGAAEYVVYPPAGLGYFLDFDATPNASLFYAQRRNQLVLPQGQVFPDGAQVDPLLLAGSLVVERETSAGSGSYELLTIGSDALVDNTSGVISMATTNDVLVEGTASIVSNILMDLDAQFITDGVQIGYLVEVLTTTAEGVYTVTDVLTENVLQLDVAVSPSVVGASYRVYESREILADRYFDEVQLVDPSTRVERINVLGVATNSPRLSVPLAYVGSSGFRFGGSTDDPFANVVIVPNDGSFTSPALNTIEVSETTGNLNFALLDLGATIYWSRILAPKIDYALSAGLGLVQFTSRLLSEEEVRITYTVEPPTTNPPTPIGPPVQEYATFLIRKEVTQPHPAPTSTLQFNTASLGDPHPLPVASNPPPAVFRGGRPQKLGVQCSVDTELSTINFLSDSQITDALPHGAIVNPSERVYIDYYVTRAFGGEQTFTVLNPPIHTAAVSISDSDSNGDPNNQFVVAGDQTSKFPANSLLRIETEQVYLIGSSTYDSGPDQTTVTLFGNQVFQDSFTDPKLYVSSGPTPVTGVSYFVTELSSFEAIARGSNTFFVAGDHTLSYLPGVVLYFTDSGATFTDFLLVTGSAYDVDTSRTKVMLSANALRQYVGGQQFLSYSIRPIYEAPTTDVRTRLVPVLTQPYSVFRRIAGEAGEVLSSPNDYSIDDTGRIVFTSPLAPNEEFSIFYTGRTQLSSGVNIRASYVNQVSPNEANGLLGQSLLADYAIRSPDSFYYRVETMTNFRGEYSKEIEAAASSGSSGPLTSNASQPELFEQGRKSLYFDERHLANQDIIARSSLLFYNDLVNLLEDYRKAVDGTSVGNNDGPLLFDGTVGATHPPGTVTNQIDDTIKISNAPYTITFPPFTVTSIGTFKKYYLPGPLSRFYPTAKNFFGVSAVTGSTVAGDEVVDTRSTNVTQVSNLHTRLAWGIITESTQFSGPNTLKVDFALGTEPGFDSQAETYARPPFKNGMKCLVQARDGSFINPPGNPVTIIGVSANQLTISGGLAGTVNVGDTVFRDPADDSSQSDPDTLTNYVLGRDYSFNGEQGQLTYVGPNGVTPPGDNTPLIANQALSGSLTLSNTLTAPLEFPALFGGIEDDDGDLSFPIQTPDPNSEQLSYLATESKLITTGTGLIRTRTTAPLISTGSVISPSFSTIVDASISSMSPAPQQHDLVRILTGVNGGSAFRRITSVGVGSLNVDSPYSASAGFTYELAVSALVATGTATSGAVFQLTDTTASFLSTVKVGQTIIFPGSGRHRQIYEINSNTTISFTPSLPIPGVVFGTPYRISKSLATYGAANLGQETDLLASWSAVLTGELALYPLQQTELLDALDLVFTDVATGATGQATATQATFNDPSGTFLDDGVASAQFIYILTGANAGIYEIQSVNSQTQVTATTPFPATLSGISYRIVSLFGMSGDSVKALFSLYQAIASLISPIAALQAKLTQAPVIGFDNANTWANSLIKTDLDTREGQVAARLAAIPAISSQVAEILANTDQIYDKRYVWIDTRINLESGLVVQQSTATANRIKAQADILKQLTKLLAVESA